MKFFEFQNMYFRRFWLTALTLGVMGFLWPIYKPHLSWTCLKGFSRLLKLQHDSKLQLGSITLTTVSLTILIQHYSELWLVWFATVLETAGYNRVLKWWFVCGIDGGNLCYHLTIIIIMCCQVKSDFWHQQYKYSNGKQYHPCRSIGVYLEAGRMVQKYGLLEYMV